MFGGLEELDLFGWGLQLYFAITISTDIISLEKKQLSANENILLNNYKKWLNLTKETLDIIPVIHLPLKEVERNKLWKQWAKIMIMQFNLKNNGLQSEPLKNMNKSNKKKMITDGI